MFGMLASGLGSLLKTVAPSAINWGLNKLSNTGIGRFIAPAMPLLKTLIPPKYMPQIQPGMQTQTVGPVQQGINQWVQEEPTPVKPAIQLQKKIRKRRRR